MSWYRKLYTCLFLSLFLILPIFFNTPLYASDNTFIIEKGSNLVSKHDLDPKKGTVFNLSRLYYDLRDKKFILDMTKLSENAVNSGIIAAPHHITYIIQPETGREQWLRTLRTEDLFTNSVYPLPPFSNEITFYSEVLRKEGNKTLRQPFGNHFLSLEIKEKVYKKKKLGSGALFGDFKWHSETVGKGYVKLKIIDPDKNIVFSLKEKYTENSEEYILYWSPDGRYLFMVVPHSSSLFGGIKSFSSYKFLIAGPFKTNQNTPLIQAALSQKREALSKNTEKDTPKETRQKSYGSLYVSARTKIVSCLEIKEKTGEILSLSVKDKGDILNFGNPILVGKHYVFTYQGQKSKGKIRVSAIKPQYIDKWWDKYKNYLETADIQTESNNYHVTCS